MQDQGVQQIAASEWYAPLLTADTVWAGACVVLGLLLAIGLTETSKRFEPLFGRIARGEHWQLRVKLYAALLCTVATTLLIFALTGYPPLTRALVGIVLGLVAGMFSGRAYDEFRTRFPAASDKMLGALSGHKS